MRSAKIAASASALSATRLVCVVMVTSACGYALAGRGSFLPDYIRVVGIPAFENKTESPTLSGNATETPTCKPTLKPSLKPTKKPTNKPTNKPTPIPTQKLWFPHKFPKLAEELIQHPAQATQKLEPAKAMLERIRKHPDAKDLLRKSTWGLELRVLAGETP